jgi:serine/threonine protein kinase
VHPALVTTRHYRAPEIVLGRAYSLPVDIFSIGCVLFELFTGRLLFDTHQDDEHLKLIERALGAFPASFAQAAPQYFRADGTLLWNAQTASKVECHCGKQYLTVFLPVSSVLDCVLAFLRWSMF